ncbi:Solute carrier 2, facilitated glucose transporter member 5 [Branchiostoma belcheri]|nr:Solute carrier 2, facilitated glucose transporter member 5 [Branchiostoma belcheri]
MRRQPNAVGMVTETRSQSLQAQTRLATAGEEVVLQAQRTGQTYSNAQLCGPRATEMEMGTTPMLRMQLDQASHGTSRLRDCVAVSCRASCAELEMKPPADDSTKPEVDFSEATKGKLTCLLAFCVLVADLGSFQFGYTISVLNAPEQELQKFYNESFFHFFDVELGSDHSTLLWSCTVSIYCLGGLFGSLMVGPLTGSFLGRRRKLLYSFASRLLASENAIVKLLLRSETFCSSPFWRNYCRLVRPPKWTMVSINLLSVTGALLMWGSRMQTSFQMIIVGRTIMGVHNGCAIGVVPMYLSEVSPPNLRGAIGVTHQLFITIGILVSQIFGLQQILGNEERWPYLLGFYIIPAAFQTLFMMFLPESPRCLLIDKDNPEASRKALKKIHGSHVNLDVYIQEMKIEHENEMKEPKMSLLALIKSRSLRPQLMVCVLVMLGQQFSGVNAIFFYSTSIFLQAGVPAEYSDYATIGVGGINVLMTVVSVMVIDKAGRKALLLWPVAFMAFSFAILTVTLGLTENLYCECGCQQGRWPTGVLDSAGSCILPNVTGGPTGTPMTTAAPFEDPYQWIAYLSIVFIILFIVAFAIGLGPIPFIITGEMFRQGARPAAYMIIGSTNLVANGIVGLVFPILQARIGAFTFLIFMAVCVLLCIFIAVKVPETKNKTFEDIQKLFGVREDTSGEAPNGIQNAAYVGTTYL